MHQFSVEKYFFNPTFINWAIKGSSLWRTPFLRADGCFGPLRSKSASSCTLSLHSAPETCSLSLSHVRPAISLCCFATPLPASAVLPQSLVSLAFIRFRTSSSRCRVLALPAALYRPDSPLYAVGCARPYYSFLALGDSLSALRALVLCVLLCELIRVCIRSVPACVCVRKAISELRRGRAPASYMCSFRERVYETSSARQIKREGRGSTEPVRGRRQICAEKHA